MPTTLDDVLGRLDLVRRSPRGFMARCPAHADRTPSLSVRLIGGHVACRCFGCGAGTRDVYQVLGLGWDGAADPPTPFALALTLGRRQEGYRRRDEHHQADEARVLLRLVAELRQEATTIGDCEEAWELLEQAAAYERQAWSVGV